MLTINYKPEQLIIALDFPAAVTALNLAERLSPLRVSFKVGLELFMAAGPRFVKELAAGHRVFLDLKYHDIPDTVVAAVRQAAALRVFMLNLHAAGGSKMMISAREALSAFQPKPLLIAVTALTSLSDRDLVATGCAHRTTERVLLLARLAAQAGLDGVVCAAHEIGAVKSAAGSNFVTVTPGLRAKDSSKDDQVRVATPKDVVAAGGDYLVAGRLVTKAADPFQAVLKILTEMGISSATS